MKPFRLTLLSVIFVSTTPLQSFGNGVPSPSLDSEKSVAVAPQTHDFGSVEVGKSKDSPSGFYKVYCNTSEGFACTDGRSTTITSVETSSTAHFIIVNDACTGKTLSGSIYCTFQVRFSPRSGGVFTPSITVDSTGGSNTVWFARGTGIVPPPNPIPSLPPSAGSSTPRVEAPACEQGSIIDVDNQVYGEVIPIVGSELNLHYFSDRVPGRKDLFDNQKISIPIISGATSASVVIASYPSGVRQTHTVNFVAGQTSPVEIKNSFHNFTGEADLLTYQADISYRPGSATRSTSGVYGGWPARSVGIGGWTVSVHHFYNHRTGRIYFGYGGSRYISEIAFADTAGKVAAIASEDGAEIYLFDVFRGRHLRTVDGLSGVEKYRFLYTVGNNKLSSVTDSWGNITRFERNGSGAITGITSPNGQFSRITLDSNAWLNSLVDPLERKYTVTSSPSGLIQTFTNPGGQVSTVTYNPDGTLKKDVGAFGTLVDLTKVNTSNGWKIDVKTASGRITSHTISTDGKDFNRTSKHPDGRIQSTASRPAGVSTSSSPNGVVETVTLAKDSRLKWAAPYPAASSTLISRSRINAVKSVTVTNTLSNPNDITSLTSKVVRTKIQNDENRIWTSTYTKADRTLLTVSPMGASYRTTYDEKGLPIFHIKGLGRGFLFEYDEKGRLISEKLSGVTPITIRTRTYDDLGNLFTLTDWEGNTTEFHYDLAGRIKDVISPKYEYTTYIYDENDNLKEVQTRRRPRHRMTYNALNFLTGYLPMLNVVSPKAKTFSFNRERQLTTVTNPNGQKLVYTYNTTTGLLDQITSPQGPFTFTYYPLSGLPKSSTSPDKIVTSKSFLGPLPILESTSIGGGAVSSLTTDYNSEGMASNIRYTVGTESFDITQNYNLDSKLSRVGSQAIIYATSSHRPKELIFDNFTETIGYDEYGTIKSISQVAGRVRSAAYEATMHPDGKISSLTKFGIRTSSFESYEYDVDGRLTAVKDRDENIISRYVYSDNGTRVVSTKLGSPQGYSTTYGPEDRVSTFAGSIRYGYNDNGERISRTDTSNNTVTTYSYDAFGNLKTVVTPSKQTISYLYDARNRRVAKKVNNVVVNWYVYLDQYRIGTILNGSRKVIASYVYGTRLNIPDYIQLPDGLQLKVFSKPNGTPISLNRLDTGAPYASYSIDPFGIVTSVNPVFPFGLAGGLYDPDTKLYHFGARDYDPEVATWVQRDPVLLNGGDANIYRYVNHDPVNWIDPSGNIGLPGFIVGGALGGLGGVLSAKASKGNLMHGFLAGVAVGSVSGATGAWAAQGAAGMMLGVSGQAAVGLFGAAQGGFVTSLLTQQALGKKPSVGRASTDALFCGVNSAGGLLMGVGFSTGARHAIEGALGISLMPLEILSGQ